MTVLRLFLCLVIFLTSCSSRVDKVIIGGGNYPVIVRRDNKLNDYLYWFIFANATSKLNDSSDKNLALRHNNKNIKSDETFIEITGPGEEISCKKGTVIPFRDAEFHFLEDTIIKVSQYEGVKLNKNDHSTWVNGDIIITGMLMILPNQSLKVRM